MNLVESTDEMKCPVPCWKRFCVCPAPSPHPHLLCLLLCREPDQQTEQCLPGLPRDCISCLKDPWQQLWHLSCQGNVLIGCVLPFKIQLSIKWSFLAVKMLHFRQVPWAVISCEGFTVSNRWSHRRTWLYKMVVSLRAALIRLGYMSVKGTALLLLCKEIRGGHSSPNVVSFKKALL